MWLRTIGLTGMITGSGQVNLLLGRIWRYRVGFGSVGTRCRPAGPRRARACGEAGRLGHAMDSTQMPNSIKKFFSFSNMFYKL
jgi:hypothetical protein